MPLGGCADLLDTAAPPSDNRTAVFAAVHQLGERDVVRLHDSIVCGVHQVARHAERSDRGAAIFVASWPRHVQANSRWGIVEPASIGSVIPSGKLDDNRALRRRGGTRLPLARDAIQLVGSEAQIGKPAPRVFDRFTHPSLQRSHRVIPKLGEWCVLDGSSVSSLGCPTDRDLGAEFVGWPPSRRNRLADTRIGTNADVGVRTGTPTDLGLHCAKSAPNAPGPIAGWEPTTSI